VELRESGSVSEKHLAILGVMTAVRWKTQAVLSALTVGLIAAAASPADSADVEVRVKAAYIYNFARFVEWPAGTSAGPVRIGVLGRGDLVSPLEAIVLGKSVGGRAITVTPVGTPAEAECCEILLIERSESKKDKEIAQSLAGKPVLTVSDDENASRDGIMIAFQLVDDSVRFQINQEAAARAGLKISSQLLKVAIPAERTGRRSVAREQEEGRRP
jgi:hypothetical protein